MCILVLCLLEFYQMLVFNLLVPCQMLVFNQTLLYRTMLVTLLEVLMCKLVHRFHCHRLNVSNFWIFWRIIWLLDQVMMLRLLTKLLLLWHLILPFHNLHLPHLLHPLVHLISQVIHIGFHLIFLILYLLLKLLISMLTSLILGSLILEQQIIWFILLLNWPQSLQ